MSQHLIHVCVTDAPAGNQREGGKSKRTQKSNQTGWEGAKNKRGRGGGKGQHKGANENEERRGEADKKTEIRLIRFLRKAKGRGGGRGRFLGCRCCSNTQRIL